MATLKNQTITSTYDQLVKRQDSYSSNGNQIELMNDSGVYKATALYLDADNSKVGIGTSTPESSLDIEGGTAQLRIGRSDSGTSNTMGGLYFGNGTDNFLCGVVGIEDGANDAGMLKFNVEGTGVGIGTAMTIKSSGRVGIGTTQPDVNLHIESTATTSTLLDIRSKNSDAGADACVRFYHGSTPDLEGGVGFNAGTSTMFLTAGSMDNQHIAINSSGQVGINTSDPTHRFDVSNTANDSVIAASCYSDGSTSHSAVLVLQTSNHDTIGTKSVTQDNRTIGQVLAYGVNDASGGDAFAIGGGISFVQDGSISGGGNYVPTEILFSTSDGSGGLSAHMRVTPAGDVGINSSAPSSELEIESSGAGHVQLSLCAKNSNNGDAMVRFGGTNAGDSTASELADFDWGIGWDKSANTFVMNYASGGVETSSTGAYFTATTAGVMSGDFNDTSDRNLKKNIADNTYGLSTVNQLRAVKFDWKNETKGKGVGFIAQEVESIVPEIVHGDDYTIAEVEVNGVKENSENAGKSINVTGIVSILVKAVQELSAKVTALENK
jgi:hypothetical protein